MGKVWFHLNTSLDGFVAGPDMSVENPIGVGGMRLFEWQMALEAWRRMSSLSGGEVNASTPVFEEAMSDYGAVVMGRRMFGGGPGPWPDDPPWNGWWGDEPSYHTPVFVLTHYPRDPLPMRGGTTFFFVTEGIERAVAKAREAAGDGNVVIGGGAQVARDALAAGLVDEFELSVTPVVLGRGKRLFEGVGAPTLEQIRVVEAPGVTHVRYRVHPSR
jgi:dihydrofolate reductase